MSKKKNDRVTITLSDKQLEILDELVKDGILGKKRSDIARWIIIQHLQDYQKRKPISS